MKLRFSDRLLMVLESVLFAGLVICLALNFFGCDLLGQLKNGILASTGSTVFRQMIVGGLALIGVMLAVFIILVAFRHEKKNKNAFVMLGTDDKGQVKIAVSAIKDMVQKSISNFEGVSQMEIRIHTEQDVIRIDVDCVISAGNNVPRVTQNVQRAIRGYVEENCGITVKSVDVTVNAVEVLPETMRIVNKPESINASETKNITAPRQDDFSGDTVTSDATASESAEKETAEKETAEKETAEKETVTETFDQNGDVGMPEEAESATDAAATGGQEDGKQAPDTIG